MEQMVDFLPQMCYTLGVEATNCIADFAALCYGNPRALYAYPLVASTPTAMHMGRFI